MNPTAKIVAAGLLGLQAQAAREAFAAHKMALESILEGHHEVPVHHSEYYLEREHPIHTQSHRYEHEYRHHYDEDREAHAHYYHHDDEPVHHTSYDRYEHEYTDERHSHDELPKVYEDTCTKKDYCDRFAKLLAHNQHDWVVEDDYHHYSEHKVTAAYFVEPDSLVVHEDSIHCRLTLHHHDYYSNEVETRNPHLDLHLALFQEGIMQVKVKASNEDERFSISNTGIGVDWDQIKVQQHLQDFVQVLDDGILISGQDRVTYKVQFDPFRIIQYVDGHETIIVNDNDNLFYDRMQHRPAVHHEAAPVHHEAVAPAHHEAAPVHHEAAPVHHEAAPVHHEAVAPAHHEAAPVHHEATAEHHANAAFKQGYAVGMDFTVNAAHMFGLPQRSDNFRLQETGTTHPYRLFNQDVNPEGRTDKPLFGSIPYITGHSHVTDASIAWMNSAETYVFLNHAHHGEKTNSAFVSEGNALEFYLLGAKGNPKKLQKKLSELTGYTPMPPMHSLGYHFAKWEQNSAHQIVERNHDFSKFGFPVDVFWFDSEYAQDYNYGEFDHTRFSMDDVMHMNNQVHGSGRRFVIAADPHIHASKDYFMYKEGLARQGKLVDEHHISNLFVRGPDAQKPFEGESRAGKSVWVDFLNDSACDYWKDLFHPSVFKGTNYMYGVWNDMNEPSVFKSAEDHTKVGMPSNNTHMTSDGDVLQHRWIHNAYGALQQRATFQGLLRRDRGQQRPFLLSESFFFGSQRYGTVAAGQNHSQFDSVELSVNSMLSLGVSGIVNAGFDVPGWAGVPEDDLFVQWYQLGVYYPFFRANSKKGFEMREPWLQSPRVQRAALAAIKQRYAQSHYMYNAFFESSRTGVPIVRPMWYEFPQDEMTFDLNHQFMFGNDILVSPKIGHPCVEDAIAGSTTEIEVYLPPTQQWYDIYSKLEVDSHDDIHIRHIGDAEQGTFVRGGSILPVLNFNDNAESLLQAIEDPIRLEIYADTMGKHPEAHGHLYLDDGENHNNRHHERTQVRYDYDGKLISVTKSIGDENLYANAATKIIDEVMIFGVEKAPKRVLNRFAMQARDQGDVEVHHVYVESTKMVHLWHLRLPVDEGLFHNKTVELLELQF